MLISVLPLMVVWKFDGLAPGESLGKFVQGTAHKQSFTRMWYLQGEQAGTL